MNTNLESMPDMNELDDLGNLFEFGDIDLNTINDPVQYGDHMSQKHDTHPNTPFLDMSEAPPLPGTSAHDFGGSDQFNFPQSVDQHSYAQQHDPHAPTSHPYTTEGMYQPSIQQPYNPYPSNFNFQPQPGFPANQNIPPTPNSYEMYGETGRFLQQQQPHMDSQQRAFLEQRYQVRKDDAIAFTPMVSPAGTPQYSIVPEFTTPGAYFSPLTSPMLQAQLQQQGYLTNPSTAASSTTNSPIHPGTDVEMLDGLTLPESARLQPRKSRRKVATQRSTPNVAKVKQSSSQASQKRKSASQPTIATSTAGSDGLATRSLTSQPTSAGTQIPSQFDSSETGSISPEHLSEAVMGPPPRPGSSLNQSPALKGQQRPTASPAATPKSLLTMRGGQQTSTPQQTPIQNLSEAPAEPGSLDILALPEAARSQGGRTPSLTQINTQLGPAASDDHLTRSSSRKTPKLDALSTPTSTRSGSVLISPSLVGSPMTASTPAGILKDKKDARSGRGSKKRGSMSASTSTLVSPALVPKISPSIKPLLPEGTPLNTATQAMLLASKSNYQNLVEGNHLPGVTYPDSLSTGLTSKRTSHKVAEQGRRNRINEALKEMQNLIPKASRSAAALKDSSEGDGDNGSAEVAMADGEASATNTNADGASSKDDAAAKNSNSKAATVELANEYIKKMQKESAVQSAEMLVLKQENDKLRKRLAEQLGEDGRAMDSASPVDSSGSS